MLYAFESVGYDGPWVVPEDYDKLNGVLRWSMGDDGEGIALTGTGYRGQWNATNQISQRPSRRGWSIASARSIRPTAAKPTRVGLNAEYWRDDDAAVTRANAFMQYYALDLFSNFTYFLDDPVNGDQIEQVDERVYSGANVSLSRQWRSDGSHRRLSVPQRQHLSPGRTSTRCCRGWRSTPTTPTSGRALKAACESPTQSRTC